MNKTQNLLKTFGLLLILGASLTACGGSDKWKEEVLLHDGSKLIVERSQTYGGNHELGQGLPIKEHTIGFTLPKSNKLITWKSEYGEELGRTNFNLLAVHVLNGTPYLVTEPNLCLSYNKWGRPNPPYIIFKYDGSKWQRIPLSQLPPEFKTLNVTISLGEKNVEEMTRVVVVSADDIIKRNSNLRQPEFQTLLKEPIKAGELGTDGSSVNCIELVYYKGALIMPNDPVAKAIVDRRSK